MYVAMLSSISDVCAHMSTHGAHECGCVTVYLCKREHTAVYCQVSERLGPEIHCVMGRFISSSFR